MNTPEHRRLRRQRHQPAPRRAAAAGVVWRGRQQQRHGEATDWLPAAPVFIQVADTYTGSDAAGTEGRISPRQRDCVARRHSSIV
ncbi:MAG: hypothetical protein U5L46_07955 [Agrobacterium sp.]|nr:hypothetical protein [Agrobacterium sp.]